MFFFEAIPLYNAIVWLVVLGILIGLNEFVRSSKLVSISMFMVLPVILTSIWLMRGGNEITSWFTWVKVYSALAGSLIYMVIRFTDYHKRHKWYIVLVPAILAINILEAAVRELQVGLAGFNGLVDGMYYISGGWNYANAAAGILSMLLICGWVGIYGTTGKRKDMVWPDQTIMYIIAYAVWNISYVYSCAPGNAFYSGVALNIAPIIPALFWAKGTWMQNRAHTLSFWMMWVMTFPYFFATGSAFNVSVSYNAAANWTLALISLALNAGLAIWQVYRIVKYRFNPLKDEIWTDSKNTRTIHIGN
ncbi:DUF5692 family protein [Alkaliphilus peptidifermentans]|uniref:Uncharacterized protein n=1 Tax=Alkaliphilus peptidifermentans DSM 18978 TaxID=1120976 RepID=A0A1G5IKN8_9FIRM|nr:DUF5692 family protein [Alkaliphilus peptidifermentans]SCY76270.1 hypothetical protein SAMN03080606_02417 [Alkaliphilus peptidifermentans DSM 18978]